MERISTKPHKDDKHRWSTSILDNANREEQVIFQPSCLTVLTDKLGIAKEKAEQACVATGFRSPQAATDWLLERKNDNKLIKTEFILILCCDTRLDEQIRTFIDEAFRYLTKENPGKYRSHLRAVKLSSFFHVPDRYVYLLHQVFDSVVQEYLSSFKRILKFTLHLNNEYIMLIPDNESKKILEILFQMIKQKFEKLVSNVIVLPAKNFFHLTLVHGLSSLFNVSINQRTTLTQLAKICIDFDRPINWTLRLYSRQQSSSNEVVYRVVSSINETTINSRLLLKPNDLFMVLDNGRLGEQENVFGE